jgi:mono/diheme cytochrome c family protein
MRQWIIRYYWLAIVVLIPAALLLTVGSTLAQPPVPHGVIEGDDCLSCHEAGVADALRLSRDHMGRRNKDCAICHEASGAFADNIPHPITGREDCLSCHSIGIGTILARSHLERTNDQCELCHLPSPAMVEPTSTPEAGPLPTPEAGPPPSGAETCAACHQRTFADEGHALFTSQPLGDPQAGATLFAQQCAICHGEDGTAPMGQDGNTINSEAYWGTHDDADILKDIGITPHGEMPAFAEDYGGPLSWEELLDLMTFIRSWGAMAPPSGIHAVAGPTYNDTIGPLLTDGCGACHGTSAGLSVTDYEALMAGSSAGPVIVPGDPEGSSIVDVLRGEHFVQLGEAELETLIAWIAIGAPESAGVTETLPLPEGKPVPHKTEGQEDCLLCHGEGGLKPVPTDYKGRTNAQCVTCHQAGS